MAIKTLPLELAHDEEYLQRIENEAKILAKLSNPNINFIHDRVKHSDAIYPILDYVPGITVVDQLIRSKRSHTHANKMHSSRSVKIPIVGQSIECDGVADDHAPRRILASRETLH